METINNEIIETINNKTINNEPSKNLKESFNRFSEHVAKIKEKQRET